MILSPEVPRRLSLRNSTISSRASSDSRETPLPRAPARIRSSDPDAAAAGVNTIDTLASLDVFLDEEEEPIPVPPQRELLTAPYFAEVSRAVANLMLANQPNGYYLVRRSAQVGKIAYRYCAYCF